MKYKELEESILVFRFSNTIFLGSWNSKYIDSMRITIAEDIGMQILALLTMEAPKDFTSHGIQKAKRDVLRCIQKDSSSTFFVNTPEWRGVTFYIESAKSDQGVMIEYKKSIFPKNETSERNRIFLPIPPNEDFYINLNYKVPGENYWASVRVPMVPSKNV